MLLGRSEQSLKDANRALQSDKSCFRAILQKAEAHFAAGDFEQALVYFHRGYQIRCDVDEFRLGVQKSQEAIMEAIFGGHDQESDSNQTTASAPQITIEDHTSVQSQVTKPITTASMTIKGRSQMQISQATLSEVKEGRVPVPPSTVQNFDKRPLRSRRTLGRLSDDKQFLEELAKNADLGKKGSVGKIAEMGVVYLNKREGFWKQQVTKSSSAPLPSTIRVSSPFRTDRLKQSDSSSSHNVDPPTLRGTAQHSGVASMIPLKGASILPPISSSSAKPAEITTPKSTEQEQLTTQFKEHHEYSPKHRMEHRNEILSAYIEDSHFCTQQLQLLHHVLQKKDGETASRLGLELLSRFRSLIVPDKPRIAIQLFAIMGRANRLSGRHQYAKMFYRHMLELSLEQGDTRSVTVALGGAGEACQSLRDYKQALELYDLQIKSGAVAEIGEIHIRMAQSHHELGNHPMCLYHCNMCIQWLEHNQPRDRAGQIRNLHYRLHANSLSATSLKLTGNAREAAIRYEIALELARKANEADWEVDILETLVSLYTTLVDPEKTALFQQQLTDIRKKERLAPQRQGKIVRSPSKVV
eukprot:TRINITY_DN3662_c0_g1_i4.p1 TRINITY_DN3662_c0_g1~~TRINITY_DN3662_c0_g1_i4.p1  ORF type:complete len:584 (+),score=122.20 TRINITY_DN3662_c0_g1_i4:237-1988(+)